MQSYGHPYRTDRRADLALPPAATAERASLPIVVAQALLLVISLARVKFALASGWDGEPTLALLVTVALLFGLLGTLRDAVTGRLVQQLSLPLPQFVPKGARPLRVAWTRMLSARRNRRACPRGAPTQ